MPGRGYLWKIREALQAFEAGDEMNLVLDLKHYIDRHYKRPAHVYSVTKKLIKKHIPDNPVLHQAALDVLHETKTEKETSQAKAQEALEKRNDTVTRFSANYVMSVMNDARSPENSTSFEMTFVALQLAVGCRQRDLMDAELCSFLEDRTSAFHVIQLGGTKIRGKKRRYRKPLVYFNAPIFFEFLERLRGWIRWEVATRDLDVVISSWNRKLCEKTRELFPVEQERSGTHVNRALYAAMMRWQNKKSSGVRETQKALGHDRMSSSLHYLYVEVE